METLDFKKQYKDLYAPKAEPCLIDVPKMRFIAVEGSGAPEGERYQGALAALYALCYTIKMSKMGSRRIEGYREYVVPPLEGLWWSADGFDVMGARASWQWLSLIRQPEFVTRDVFDWAVCECRQKKPDVDVSGARLVDIAEGLCVQMMHVGPYSTEPASLLRIDAFIAQNGLQKDIAGERRHHEIYLGDPRKIAPEKRKTVLRIPVRRA